ncbi:FtsB family cell division protein [Nocardioides pacificus]
MSARDNARSARGSGRGGPGGSRRPGERGTPRARSVAPAPPSGRPARRRPRLTGRAAVLVLVLAVLAVSYASSLRAYLEQRTHLSTLRSQIAEREADISALEREKRRWDDPAYVEAQARERLGYLMPGETGFQVLDENGEPLGAQAALHDPQDVVPTEPTAWWTTAWGSMELAGRPPRADDGPADEIGPPPTEKGDE